MTPTWAAAWPSFRKPTGPPLALLAWLNIAQTVCPFQVAVKR
jgi:hypothetical protein